MAEPSKSNMKDGKSVDVGIEGDNLEMIVDRSKAERNWKHYAAIYLWLGWFNFYGCLFVSFPLIFLFWPLAIPYFFIVGVLAVSFFSTVERHKQPLWGKAIGAWMMRSSAEYFGVRVFLEKGAKNVITETHPALFCMEPHDILPIGIFSLSKYLGYFPTHDCMGCLSSVCFLAPGMRHVYTWGHATDVNKKTILKHLDNKTSLALCPGGAQEVTYMSSPNSHKECVLYLKKRLGIVKIAAQTGVPLIPVFVFNQRTAWDYWIPSSGYVHWLGRQIGFIPLVFCGVGGLLYGPPKPVPLNVVVGKPISVPDLQTLLLQKDSTQSKGDSSSSSSSSANDASSSSSAKQAEEAVLRPYLDQFVAAMQRIYEENKDRFDMGDVELRIE